MKQEDKLPEGLEEAAEEHAGLNFDRQMEYKSFWNDVDTFKAGAEWQKAKMMEKAVDGEVVAGKEVDKWFVTYIGDYESMLKVCKPGDKVKVIVISDEK